MLRQSKGNEAPPGRKHGETNRNEVITRLASMAVARGHGDNRLKRKPTESDRESRSEDLAAKLLRVETQLKAERKARQIAEEKLAEATIRFQTFVETIPQLVWTAEPDGTLDYVNHQVLKYFNRSYEEMTGWNWKEVLHPEDVPGCLERWNQALESGEPYEIEFRLKRGSDETYHWHLGRALPLRDQNGNIFKWLGTTTDISELKNTEEELRKSNERYRSLTQSALDAIIVADAQGLILSWNKSARAMFGYDEVEILGKSLTCLMPERYRQAHLKGINRLQKNLNLNLKISTVELRGLRKDGSEFPIELSLGSWLESGERAFCGIIRDISDRKDTEGALKRITNELETRVQDRTAELQQRNRELQAEIMERHLVEVRLRNSEAKQSAIVSALPDHMILYDKNGVVLEAKSPKKKTPGGLSPDCQKKRIDEIFPPEFASTIRHYIDRARVTKEMQLSEYQTVVNGRKEYFEARYVAVGEEEVLSVVRNVTHQKHMEQQIRQHAKSLEKIVEQRTTQIQALERQRMESEKLVALGQLAAGVAHEINNPLGVVSNGFELIKNAIPEEDASRAYVDPVDQNITRMIDIVRQMYTLYGGEKFERIPVKIEVLIRDALTMVESHARQKQISVVTDIADRCPVMILPQSELLQVLTNLIQNAIDASPDQSTVRVKVQRMKNHCRIQVIDKGAGISPEYQLKIFEPFFSTKSKGTRTNMGLGLAVSSNMIQAMGGKIDFTTQPGKGTTFTILLPMDPSRK